MSAIHPELDAVTLFVADIDRAKGFYVRAFGLAPIYEDDVAAAFAWGQVAINLLERGAAPELIEPAEIGPADAGTRMLLTVAVEDMAAAMEELEARGVELLNGPIDRPWGLRTVTFADPDGHIWELAQKIAADEPA